MEANKITLKTLAASIAAVLVMETVFSPAMTGQTASPLAALGLLRFLEIIVLVFISLRFEKDPDAIGLSRSKIFPGIVKGLIWSACLGTAAGVLFVVLHISGINPLKLVGSPLPSSPLKIIIFFLVGGVIGPVGEEIFFRGIIYGFFRRWGVSVAISISTLLFVLPHQVGSNLPIIQIVGGVLFAVAYEKEKSLMVPITIHILGNLALFSLTLVN